MNSFLIILGIVFILGGIAGSFLPGLPGPTLSFVAVAFLFFVKGPEVVSVPTLMTLGLITIVLIILDYLGPIFGAKFFGATKSGLIGAVVGVLFGTLMFFPWGVFVGPFFGAFVGELFGGKSTKKSLRASVGTFLGTFSVTIFQAVFAVGMAIYFFVKLF